MNKADAFEKLRKLTVAQLVLLKLSWHYPKGLRPKDIAKFIKKVKPVKRAESQVSRCLKNFRTAGVVTKIKTKDGKDKRGLWTITNNGLKKVRYYWLTGLVPTDLMNPYVLEHVRIRRKIVDEDGNVKYIYI